MIRTNNLALTAFFALIGLTAQAGDKEGNGGQSVNVDGRPSLRDLVDHSVCSWVNGAELLQTQKHMPQVLAALDRQHPIFRAALTREAAMTNFCMTGGDLVQVSTEDRDGLTIWELDGGQQLAVRLNDDVYVDTKIFNQLDQVSQAYLVVHEILHNFLPQDTPQRNTRLRSFVNFLRENERAPVSLEKFLYQIKMGSIQWPDSRDLLASIDAAGVLLATPSNGQESPARRWQAAKSVIDGLPSQIIYSRPYCAAIVPSGTAGFCYAAEVLYPERVNHALNYIRLRLQEFSKEVSAGNTKQMAEDLKEGVLPDCSDLSSDPLTLECGADTVYRALKTAVDADEAELVRTLLENSSSDPFVFLGGVDGFDIGSSILAEAVAGNHGNCLKVLLADPRVHLYYNQDIIDHPPFLRAVERQASLEVLEALLSKKSLTERMNFSDIPRMEWGMKCGYTLLGYIERLMKSRAGDPAYLAQVAQLLKAHGALEKDQYRPR